MNSPQFDAQFSKAQVQEVCNQLLRALREFGRLAEPGPSAPTGLLVSIPDPALDVPPRAKEGRGLGHRRPRHVMEAYQIPVPGPRGGGVYRPPMWPTHTYTEVPWHPEGVTAAVSSEMPPPVRPEIHVPIPAYPQPRTMLAPQAEVPYSYQWPGQSSQTGFVPSNNYLPDGGFVGFGGYQPAYGYPGFSAFQQAQGFVPFCSSQPRQSWTSAGSSNTPYPSGHRTSDESDQQTDDFLRSATEDFNFTQHLEGQRGVRRNPDRDARSRPWPNYTPP